MSPHWADITMAIAAVVSLFVTAGGLFAVYVQIKKLRNALWSDTHSRLTDQSFELLRFLAEKPETYEYFYNRKPLPINAPDRVFILYAAEALANFMEHLSLQRENLPQPQWLVWDRFIRSSYESSVVLQEFFGRHPTWYSRELISILDECNSHLPISQSKPTQLPEADAQL